MSITGVLRRETSGRKISWTGVGNVCICRRALPSSGDSLILLVGSDRRIMTSLLCKFSRSRPRNDPLAGRSCTQFPTLPPPKRGFAQEGKGEKTPRAPAACAPLSRKAHPLTTRSGPCCRAPPPAAPQPDFTLSYLVNSLPRHPDDKRSGKILKLNWPNFFTSALFPNFPPVFFSIPLWKKDSHRPGSSDLALKLLRHLEIRKIAGSSWLSEPRFLFLISIRSARRSFFPSSLLHHQISTPREF